MHGRGQSGSWAGKVGLRLKACAYVREILGSGRVGVQEREGERTRENR